MSATPMFPCGVTAESELESITETEDAGAPPIFTVVLGANPLPRIVTDVPPAAGPAPGVTDATAKSW